MKQIWKYELQLGENEIMMPYGSKVLTVQMQGDHVCLWAIVSPEEPEIERKFTIYGTGHPFEGGSYIGTFQMSGGSLVFHVFEVK